jgi:predicted small lipoprotein YifL
MRQTSSLIVAAALLALTALAGCGKKEEPVNTTPPKGAVSAGGAGGQAQNAPAPQAPQGAPP